MLKRLRGLALAAGLIGALAAAPAAAQLGDDDFYDDYYGYDVYEEYGWDYDYDGFDTFDSGFGYDLGLPVLVDT